MFTVQNSVFMLALSMAFAAPVQAADGGSIHRLTDAEIDAIAVAQAQRTDTAPLLGQANKLATIEEDGNARPKRKMHGEIGFGVGTGGYSQVFGTVVAPLGNNGIFAFSFAHTNGGQFYRAGLH
jgi:hypothetical protein